MIPPLWLLCVLIVGGSTLLSVVGLAVVRRGVAPKTLREHHDVAGFILAIVGVIYAVLLAFVVLVVWERYGEAELVAEREANALIDVYRLTPGIPDNRATIRQGARLYARQTIQAEWPAMNRGAMDDGTSHALDQLWRDCLRVQAKDNRENAVYNQLLERLTEVGDNRRLRLLASRSGIPGPGGHDRDFGAADFSGAVSHYSAQSPLHRRFERGAGSNANRARTLRHLGRTSSGATLTSTASRKSILVVITAQ